MKGILLLLLIIVAVLLMACGGGVSSDETAAPTPKGSLAVHSTRASGVCASTTREASE